MKNARIILGVSESASKEEIKQAYFKRLRIVHPDRFDPDSADWQNASDMLRELNRAYSFLKKMSQGPEEKTNEEIDTNEPEDDGYEYAGGDRGTPRPESHGRAGVKSKFIKRCGWVYRWGVFALALSFAYLLMHKSPLYAAIAVFFIPANLCDYFLGWKKVTRIWDLSQRVILTLFLALCFWQAVSPPSYSPLALLVPGKTTVRGVRPFTSGYWRLLTSEENTVLRAKHALPQEIPAPQSGTYWNFTKLDEEAPFTIKTSGTGYYIVKLVTPSAQTTAMEFFIHAGDTIEFDVPLGVYRMRYASGEKWYGKEELFGPATVHSQSDTIFSFDMQGNQVNGYTVTLHKIPGGNMQAYKVLKSEF